jgi:predicted phage baseplate assembly protein
MRRAAGGRDQETLEEAKERARREMRAQYRAVTAEDFESLAMSSSREVARVKCLAPTTVDSTLPPGMVELLVVPAVADSVMVGDLSRLQLNDRMINRLQAHLDEYRLLTTMLRIREPKYVGVQVRAEVVASDYARPEVVIGRVVEVLRQYISPLLPTGDSLLPEGLVESDWQGWPFGRALYVAELFSVIQQVPGVKHVLDVQIRQRPILPSKEAPPLGQLEDFATGAAGTGGQDPSLSLVTGRMLQIPADNLLCSLEHTVELVEI